MIRFEEFADIFGGTDFREEEVRKFYYSVKKSVILQLLGKHSWPELLKLEESCQWPVLRNIDDPNLPIYKGADITLLEKFMETIAEEKRIREHKSPGKVSKWSQLQSIINERTELFRHIFGFCKNDIRHCEVVADRYGRIRERRVRSRKKLWKYGIGAGTATLAGAALWYISKKDKNDR
jgi:hypothetical protein